MTLTWDEWAAYKAKHLVPVGHGPKGQPIYDHEQALLQSISSSGTREPHSRR